MWRYLLEGSQVLDSKDSEILKYFLSVYPEEGCGILLNKKGVLHWKPCKNVAENKETEFQLDPEAYISAHLEGDIYAIVHSHTNGSAEPSEHDKKASEFLKIPYIIYSIPEGEKVLYTPKELNSLTGRTYEFGKYDCWTLVRDFYKKEYNITLPLLDFEQNWWENNLNYFDDLFTDFGFEEVSNPQEGDVILFSIRANVPNHCGVYLEEDIFMHHSENRLSCRENLFPFWARFITRYARYAKS